MDLNQIDVREFMKLEESNTLSKYTISYMGHKVQINNKDMCTIGSDVTYEGQWIDSQDFSIFIHDLCVYYEDKIERLTKEYEKNYSIAYLSLCRLSKAKVLEASGFKIPEESIKAKFDSAPPTEALLKRCVMFVKLPKEFKPLASIEKKLEQLHSDYRRLSNTRRLCDTREDKFKSLNKNERERASRF